MLISDVVGLAAGREPEAPALVFGGATWTFGQVHAEVCQLAHGLREIARAGDRIAVLTENSHEYVLSYYAVPLAGMVLLPLNYRLTPREIADLLTDAAPTVLITEAKYLDTARHAADTVPSVRTVITIDDVAGTTPFREVVEGRPETEPERPDENAAGWLIYTSGTTGRAKGAVLTHRNVVAGALNAALSWPRAVEDRPVSLIPWPLCHIAGYNVLVAHLAAETVVLLRRYSAERFLEAVQHHGVTTTTVAPTMLAMLLRHPALDSCDTSSITRIGYGSAPMPVETLREAMTRFPNAGFRAGFGMTELAGNALAHGPDGHREAAAGRPELLASAGKPMLLSSARIVDDGGAELGPDQVGELEIRGDQVFSEYWKRPEATAEAFREGWFRTGDLARRDAEGRFAIVDRRKDMILTGGENVYSREVEDVLHQHPAVAAAAVVGTPDELWGERVVAVVEPVGDRHPTEDEIREFCADRLAGYKCPRQLLVVDELPRNTAGKVLKREIRERVR
ncbi:AMP-binding protein [Saccharopolyspora dendranthemae]|uniref:Acyl-CoA synthetase (AMP-forming)/AMP-acid ligase II n=1 Tax=Saccharopolyspora dendranthemae TaxID=1181886 RepID=A0A561U8F9_9PSEU|nr:AMP-binding protein [Saccharopolyspora dendranthemae]TWF95649.1 acyl-CoA synthetase (AMP-forming)/AMP-acid ligase II [Saccharopolyspora dendranthemae]